MNGENNLIIQFAKSFKDHSMAVVKHNDKTFAIPWEEIKKQCQFTEENLVQITHSIHKEHITFVFVCKKTSYIIVFNAETGNFDYIVEGKGIIKATCCKDKVIAIAKIINESGIVSVYKCYSEFGSRAWKYEDTGLKKKYAENDENDYNLITTSNDAYIKLNNPLNEVEYINHMREKYSMFCLYDYWKNKEIDASEGDLRRDSIFLEFQFGNTPETAKITYCNDIKFAAGYLKYMVLGDVAYMLLVSENERDPFLAKDSYELENEYIPDIDHLIELSIRNTKDKYRPVSLLEEMAELCDSIFMEEDTAKAEEIFFEACDICNKYFAEDIYHKSGYGYLFKAYNGADELKTRLLNREYTNMKQLNAVFEKNSWDNKDREIIKAALDEVE